MRWLLLTLVGLALAAGCDKPKATEAAKAPGPAEEGLRKESLKVKDVPLKPGEPKVVEPPKKSEYNASTAGDTTFTQPADLWGLPGQNRAVLKERFFGKRWNLDPAGNITINPDHLIAETHPHTEWLTVTVKFRDPKDLLTFDRYKSRLNGYCVDAFTFVDCVYVR